jgi:hypothetical protein
LHKRLAEIDKEEELENGEEQKQKILFDDEIDINIKVKRKRNTGDMVFDDVIESIELTEDDKIYLEKKQQQYAKEFSEFTNNDFFLYIHKNIYEPNRKYNSFILLNILEDEELFKEFIREKYKAVGVNLSGVSNFTNYKVFYTNTL